jgi:hypothetical protein
MRFDVTVLKSTFTSRLAEAPLTACESHKDEHLFYRDEQDGQDEKTAVSNNLFSL